MESNDLDTAAHTEMDTKAADLNLCSNAVHILEENQDIARNKVNCMELNISSISVASTPLTSSLKQDENGPVLGTAGNHLEQSDCLTTSGDGTDRADAFKQESCDALSLKAESAKSSAGAVSSDLFPEQTEAEDFTEEFDISAEPGDLLLEGELWQNMSSFPNADQDHSEVCIKRIYSNSSTLSARSLDPGATNTGMVGRESLILGVEINRPEVGTDDISLWSCDSSSSDYIQSTHFESTDVNLVPMESLQLSLVSNNSLMLCATGAGPTSLHTLNLNMAAADWHLGSVPVKCLELGAVNFASLTLGTVGISVIPAVSANAISTNPTTNSRDPLTQVAAAADCVNVDSITPEGVRERWHPLEDRLYVLRETLAALDRKLEVFAPRLQEVETLVHGMECSFTQHAMCIDDIMHENKTLAQRILLLEEQVKEEKQQEKVAYRNQ